MQGVLIRSFFLSSSKACKELRGRGVHLPFYFLGVVCFGMLGILEEIGRLRGYSMVKGMYKNEHDWCVLSDFVLQADLIMVFNFLLFTCEILCSITSIATQSYLMINILRLTPRVVRKTSYSI